MDAASMFTKEANLFTYVWKLKDQANEFTEEENIFEGDRTCPGLTLRCSTYEGEFAIFLFLPRRADQKGDPLTEEGNPHYALRWGS